MYDIFISYKHTDENRNVTDDYAIAEELYNGLISAGYKVFFSNKSLESTTNPRYKQEIDEVLDNVKVLIVVLTKADYTTSKWVLYEWDSFYGDYLSGIRENAYLYTYIKGFSTHELPRTLRNLQSFYVDDGINPVLKYMKNIIPIEFTSKYRVKDNSSIVFDDIKQAVVLDHQVYKRIYHIDPTKCWQWYKLNPNIYVFIEDIETHQIVAYVNTTPITDECYEKIKSGTFLTTNITEDMILSFDLPYSYNLYFFSIVVSPEYQNTELFFLLINALVEKFLRLSAHGVYIKKMISDAVTLSGEKFCALFGMRRVITSSHNSTLYEVQMIPPEFKKISKRVKELYESYQKAYEESPDLFE